MSNFISYLEIFILRNIMEIWQNHNWNSSKAVSPVVIESVRLLSIAIMSSTAKPEVKMHQQ